MAHEIFSNAISAGMQIEIPLFIYNAAADKVIKKALYYGWDTGFLKPCVSALWMAINELTSQ